jgi:hypothetical protein
MNEAHESPSGDVFDDVIEGAAGFVPQANVTITALISISYACRISFHRIGLLA